MTLPAPLSLPSATERALPKVIGGVSKWVACADAAALDGANWSDPSIILSTQRLSDLYNTGSHAANGGRTIDQLAAAVTSFFGHAPGRVSTWDAALGALRGGSVLVLAGDYHNLPAELQRWDRSFAANPGAWHEVCAGPIADGDSSPDPLLWWRDPLGTGGLYGEWVNWSTVLAFALGPGYVLVFDHLAWVATPAPQPAPPPAPGPQPAPPPPVQPPAAPPPPAATYISTLPNVRLIAMDLAHLVIPTATSYVLGAPAVIPGFSVTGEATSPAHIVSQGGVAYYLLDRNQAQPGLIPLTYTVAPGDNLSRIGARFNVQWHDIYAVNAGTIGADPNMIRVGQVLVIPGHYQ